MLQMLNYSFMVNALIVGVLISVCCALLGVVLVLKRFSMIGDGLSHVGFGALSVGAALNFGTPIYFAIPVVMLCAYLLLKITENSRINADAAIAVISSSALAVGVFVASVNGTNINIQQYMFGSILAVGETDMILSIVMFTLVCLMFTLFYHKIFAITFDENFSKATGINTKFFNTFVSLLTAVTVVVGMRMLGTLLISAMIIFPVLTSMKVCKRFICVIISSVIISVTSTVSGLWLSFTVENIPVGATIVIVNLSAYLLFSAICLITQFILKRVSHK